MFHFFWRFKYPTAIVIFFFFVFCLIQLTQTQVFFDSERILDEFSIETNEKKLIDDNNLIFYGIELNNELDFEDVNALAALHDSLKSSAYVSRVFSFKNDKKIIEGGVLPIVKKRFNWKDRDHFRSSFNDLTLQESNFISADKRHLFYLIEAKKDLTKLEQKNLVNKLNLGVDIPSKKDVYVAGRIPSEHYFENKVIFEFVLMTLLSAILCFTFLLFLTKNIRLVLLTIASVIISIVITLGVSHIIFGGIELVMIITPAILFIVAISDLMHLTNQQNDVVNDKKAFFFLRMDKIGKAIILTSITTAISFLTFLFNDIEPIVRFGLITSIGVLFTMFLAIIIYSIAIDKSYNFSQSTSFFQNLIDNTLAYFLRPKKSKLFHLSTLAVIVFGFIATADTKINNFLTDEINKNSSFYAQTNYFDENFGGIKPINIIVKKNESTNDLKSFASSLQQMGFVIDASSENNSIANRLFTQENDKDIVFYCRTKDEGSVKTFEKLNELQERFGQENPLRFAGAGYLFDNLGYDLTKKLFLGLIFAIFSIGLVFFFINGYSIAYFFVAIIPNVVPIVVCLGALSWFNFYFSLSNAFIFTIVFGLIIDDSIHLISAYTRLKKTGYAKELALRSIVTQTGAAILKTTVLIILCLTPLLFSEFKSVSQLAVITILSAFIALFFDLIYLPRLLRKIVH